MMKYLSKWHQSAVADFKTNLIAQHRHLVPVSAVQVWPNPFGEGGVWLRLPGDGVFRLQVFDEQGKLVLDWKILAGENGGLVKLESGIFPGAGVYFYRLVGGVGRWSGRMVRG